MNAVATVDVVVVRVAWESPKLQSTEEGDGLLLPVRVSLAAVVRGAWPSDLERGLGIPSRYGLRRQWVIGLVEPGPARPFSNNPAHRDDRTGRECKVVRPVLD
jgi:hypothetical protein